MLKIATIATALTSSIAAVLASNTPARKERPREERRMAPSADRPVLVELYQSQGCSSCPPANANVNAIADRPDVVALSFAVTYWDALGWKDTFASPAFTERQWDYARHNRRGNVATPQVWINGQMTIVGSNRRQLAEAIADAASGGPSLVVSGNTVRVSGGGAAKSADLWVAFYDPRTIQVPIRAGENGGRTLPHKNIVRELDRIGRWDGQARSFTLPPRRAGLATAVFLQAGKGDPVIGVAQGA
jgi:hypothetical protein